MSLSEDWNSGGSALIPGTAQPNLRDYMHALHGVSSLTALKAIKPGQRDHGMPARVTEGVAAGRWRYHATSVLTGDDVLVVVPADNPAAGRWLREPGACDLALAFSFQTADLAVLLAMQAGQRFAVSSLYWDILASMTGGTGSAIGVHSNKAAPTNWTTKGDLLGGATGDVAATLVAGVAAGTMGADMDTLAKVRGLILVSGDQLLFGRITSAFTAGNGYVRVPGILLANAGA